jgi:hypothetical protein
MRKTTVLTEAGKPERWVSANVLSVIVERGFPIPAVLAEFTRHPSSDPVHFHHMHFPAAGADALDPGFGENEAARLFIQGEIRVLERLFEVRRRGMWCPSFHYRLHNQILIKYISFFNRSNNLVGDVAHESFQTKR